MKSLPVFFLGLFISFSAYSDCSADSCVDVKVTRLVVRANGDVSVGTSGDETLLNCDSGTKGYINLSRGNDNFDAVYSLLLTAHTTEHPLWIRATGPEQCELSYVVSDR